MKIVQILPELNQGGVERGTVELSRELVKRGHQSIVISAGGRLAEQITADGGEHITHDVCSKNPLSALPRILKLKKIIRRLSPDIVHARSRVPAWMCVFALKGLDIPFVTTVHGFNSVNCYSRVMTRGDRVICVSTAVKDYIQKNYAVPDEKIRIIHRGLDPESFSPDKLDQQFIDDFKAKYNLEGKYIVALVGRISPLKNIEMFINAIAPVGRASSPTQTLLASHASSPTKKTYVSPSESNDRLEAYPTIGLIVGGARSDKQDYLNQMQQLVKARGLENTIIFTGPQSKMAEIHHLSDSLVTCSRKPESFGRSIIEAMAMGTPAIAPAIGGPLDIIIDGKTGLLFEPNNIRDLARKIEQAKSHSFDNLQEYVKENFSLESMVEKVISIYQELAAT
jgi:glycosyltransferase involved in cell wall biosynthesis